jgi:hypothetical protein
MTDYLIFARKMYNQPLELLGPVRMEDKTEANETRLAKQAHEQFGKEVWIEMIAIPQSAIAQVIPVSSP